MIPEAKTPGRHRTQTESSQGLSLKRSPTRRVPRYRTEIPLAVRVLGEDGYLTVHGRCFEIGELGLGAVITSELAAGEMVLLELSFPQVSDVQLLRAVVRHRMGYLHGFEFVGLLPEQRELISTYCRTLQSIVVHSTVSWPDGPSLKTSPAPDAPPPETVP
jgi:PilZ domain